MNDDEVKKVNTMKASNPVQAFHCTLETAGRNHIQTVNQLAAEAGGKRRLRTTHNTYLRAYPDTKIDTTVNKKTWECFYIEHHQGGKVALKAYHSPGRFVQARENKTLVLSEFLSDTEKFIPFKNQNGSWSFLSN